VQVDILAQGYPGGSTRHGGLGWSTVVLLRGGGRIAVIDSGGFGFRRVLLARLVMLGVSPSDITDLLITHLHHDHVINWPVFPSARMHVGMKELDWALGLPHGHPLVPDFVVAEMVKTGRMWRLVDGKEVWSGLTCHETPGHTPHHLCFLLRGEEHDWIFSGDAAKNRAELLTSRADLTMDEAASVCSIKLLRRMWVERPGTILIPGHDLPMVLENGVPTYIPVKREAAIQAWFGEDLETVTYFDLTGAG
jgi:glyoxylase-like metal-dependent hydrolase (beta-lactamase superfamily II)